MEIFLESFVLASLQPLLLTMRDWGPEGVRVKAGLGEGRLQGRQEPGSPNAQQAEEEGRFSERQGRSPGW